MNKIEKKCSRHNDEALFHCSEMVLGKLLGTGAFCDVHELKLLQLLSRDELDRRKSPVNTSSGRKKREYIHQTCHDGFGNPSYVVKHLRPNLTADRGIKIFTHAADDCLKELEILSRLSHPNIVRLWGSSISGRNVQENNPYMFFIILEKVNQTLSQRILQWILTKTYASRENKKTNSDAAMSLPPFYIEKLRYARDIASALAHVHSQRMVFRDLKPDNVGISSDGTAKLFDFGLCRELPSMKNCTNTKKEPIFRMSTVGTRRYMSPEMISGHGYNQKTDSYSWAMVFYEILSLRKPYAKYNREMHRILVCEQQGRPHTSSEIPWNARDLLEQSWNSDISDRMTMKEICDELNKIIDTVEQQTLPLIERSLRAVLEMAELFVFGNDKTLPCITSDAVLCNDNRGDSDRKYQVYATEEKSTVLVATRSVLTAEY